jgi:hypothetical protein
VSARAATSEIDSKLCMLRSCYLPTYHHVMKAQQATCAVGYGRAVTALLVAVIIAAAHLAAAEDVALPTAWVCIEMPDQGEAPWAIIRRNVAHDIECMGYDSYNCIWTTDEASCMDALASNGYSDVLACGPTMIPKYGNDGYLPGYWCEFGNEALPDQAEAPCTAPGDRTPIACAITALCSVCGTSLPEVAPFCRVDGFTTDCVAECCRLPPLNGKP